MSITDELRKYASGYKPMVDHTLLAIADRIDAEHDELLKNAYEDIASDEFLEGHGWVKLPVDADGVPIHVGDVMEWVDEPDVSRVVSSIQLADDGWWVYVGGTGRRPDKYRHYHPPTVEDVLREVVTLCHNTWKKESAFHFYGVDDVMESGNIAEYAAKLRLAGDGE